MNRFFNALWKAKWALGFNLVAILAYLAVSSLAWMDPRLPPEQRSLPGAPFIFFFGAFPIVVAALAIDLAWLIWRMVRALRSGEWVFWAPLAVVVCSWVSAHLINFVMLAPA